MEPLQRVTNFTLILYSSRKKKMTGPAELGKSSSKQPVTGIKVQYFDASRTQGGTCLCSWQYTGWLCRRSEGRRQEVERENAVHVCIVQCKQGTQYLSEVDITALCHARIRECKAGWWMGRFSRAVSICLKLVADFSILFFGNSIPIFLHTSLQVVYSPEIGWSDTVLAYWLLRNTCDIETKATLNKLKHISLHWINGKIHFEETRIYFRIFVRCAG